MPAGAHGDAQSTRADELHRLDHVSSRRDRDDDLRETDLECAFARPSDAESRYSAAVRQAALIPQS